MKFDKSKLPSRHVSVGVKSAPHRSMYHAMGLKNEDISNSLKKVQGVSSVFFGPGFITITKKNNFEWEVITEDIVNIFDKL